MQIVDAHGNEIKSLPRQMEESREKLDMIFKPVAKAMEIYLIHDEKMQEVIDYALHFTMKNPTMKAHRIARKVAHYFKLKTILQHEID